MWRILTSFSLCLLTDGFAWSAKESANNNITSQWPVDYLQTTFITKKKYLEYLKFMTNWAIFENVYNIIGGQLFSIIAFRSKLWNFCNFSASKVPFNEEQGWTNSWASYLKFLILCIFGKGGDLFQVSPLRNIEPNQTQKNQKENKYF